MSADTCDYVFTMEGWLRQSDEKRITRIQLNNLFYPLTTMAWKCPHGSFEDSDYCLFHMPIEEKEKLGVPDALVKEELISAIRSEDRSQEFYGSNFRNLNLEYEHLHPPDRNPIVFDYSTFKGETDFSHASFAHCTFSGAEFNGYVSFHDTEFTHKAIFVYCEFKEKAHMAADFEHYVNFDGSTFHSQIWFPADCASIASFRQVLFKGETQFNNCKADEISFRNSEIEENLELNRTEFNFLRLAPARVSEKLTASFFEAHVNSGLLTQPKEGELLFNLTQATIGDLEISTDYHDGSPLSHILVNNTTFDNFDFPLYRAMFQQNNWIVHKCPNFEVDVADVHDLESTYLKLRQGADRNGDQKAASEFFIKEMKFRKLAHLQSARNNDSISGKLKSIGNFILNQSLDTVSKYGERPFRVVVFSILTIVISALLYPAIGGIQRTNSSTVEYAFLTSKTPSSSLVSTLLDSLYFSTVTFTTLGYGDIQPASRYSSLLAGIESFTGALLMALLIFVLGRSIKW